MSRDYLLGLATLPALAAILHALTLGFFLVVRHMNRLGLSLKRGVYDLALDPTQRWVPGDWALRSWGPFHRGSWSHNDARWIGFGKRQGKRGWLGVTFIKVPR